VSDIEHPTEWPGAIKETLTRKVGPLPIWGWGSVIVGGIVAFRFVGKRGGTATATTNPVASAVAGGFVGNYGSGSGVGGTGGSGGGDTGSNPPSSGPPPVVAPGQGGTPIAGSGAPNSGPDLATTPGQGLPAKLAALITPTTTDATVGTGVLIPGTSAYEQSLSGTATGVPTANVGGGPVKPTVTQEQLAAKVKLAYLLRQRKTWVSPK